MRTEKPFLLVGWLPTALSLLFLCSAMDCRGVSSNGTAGSTPINEFHSWHAPQADTHASGGDSAQNVRLEDTDWKFSRFGSEAANETHEPTDIYLRLRSNGRGMRLFDGCNVIFGRYQLNEQKLRFLIAGVTEWQCTRAIEQRRQLLKVLQASSGWNILGEHLELYGAGSTLLARFEAQPVKIRIKLS